MGSLCITLQLMAWLPHPGKKSLCGISDWQPFPRSGAYHFSCSPTPPVPPPTTSCCRTCSAWNMDNVAVGLCLTVTGWSGTHPTLPHACACVLANRYTHRAAIKFLLYLWRIQLTYTLLRKTIDKKHIIKLQSVSVQYIRSWLHTFIYAFCRQKLKNIHIYTPNTRHVYTPTLETWVSPEM